MQNQYMALLDVHPMLTHFSLPVFVGTAGLTASEESAEPSQAGLTAAASTQVQLSVLRAELAASDAELQHARDHLAIVLKQLGPQVMSAGASGAPGGQLQQQQQQHQQPSEVDFLREVRGSKWHGSRYCFLECDRSEDLVEQPDWARSMMMSRQAVRQRMPSHSTQLLHSAPASIGSA